LLKKPSEIGNRSALIFENTTDREITFQHEYSTLGNWFSFIVGTSNLKHHHRD
jgi:hypothetical protein